MMLTCNTAWNELEACVGDVEALLKQHEVEVWSPDGWVEVTEFVNKGIHPEYEVILENGYSLRCSAGHKFESTIGWITTEELMSNCEIGIYLHILTDTGKWIACKSVTLSDKQIPIVDISVNHPNHRYYTNGISSHNTGKSLFLCDIAASSIIQGYNVLYITLEMAEEKIAERIDCNILDVTIDELYRMKRAEFVNGVNGIKAKTHGRLIIKEYPTGGAHVGHFRALLEDLKMKQDFLPDVICVDYINICASQKYKSSNYNSYFAVKAIAEELRGLMVEYNCVGWTATQVTRAGFSDSDFDMTSTSESFGVPATLDGMFGLIRTEELDKMGQLMIKQLKSRFNDVNYYNKFVIGADIKKFKLFDVEESQQTGITDRGNIDDIPLFDKSYKSRNFDDIKFD